MQHAAQRSDAPSTEQVERLNGIAMQCAPYARMHFIVAHAAMRRTSLTGECAVDADDVDAVAGLCTIDKVFFEDNLNGPRQLPRRRPLGNLMNHNSATCNVLRATCNVNVQHATCSMWHVA
jgi:hypothetical protein